MHVRTWFRCMVLMHADAHACTHAHARIDLLCACLTHMLFFPSCCHFLPILVSVSHAHTKTHEHMHTLSYIFCPLPSLPAYLLPIFSCKKRQDARARAHVLSSVQSTSACVSISLSCCSSLSLSQSLAHPPACAVRLYQYVHVFFMPTRPRRNRMSHDRTLFFTGHRNHHRRGALAKAREAGQYLEDSFHAFIFPRSGVCVCSCLVDAFVCGHVFISACACVVC